MRYLRFVVEGLISFSTPGIRRLEWTPTADYQMILGTNGTGKSTLLREMSPCPAPADRYHKPGMKQIELEHQHSIYICTSTFGPRTAEHSFLKDGIELNKGGTQAIQRELVLKHFNYSEKLHDLLIGHFRERFTKMSAEQRRYWIMRLPRSDYSFAQRFAEQVRSARRDMEGALKKAKLRLNEETTQLHGMVDANGIEGRVTALQEDLTALLYARSSDAQPFYRAEHSLKESIGALERAGEAVVRCAEQIDLHGTLRDESALAQHLQALTGEIQLKDGILDRLKHEFSEIETLLGTMDAAHLSDGDDVERTLLQLGQRQIELERQIGRFPELKSVASPEVVERTTAEILSSVMGLFADLPDNSDRRYSRDNIAKAQDLRRQAQDETLRSEASIATLKGRLHAIEHTDGVDCPECRHHWVPGLMMGEVEELNAKVSGLQHIVANCAARIAETDKYLEEVEIYMGHYRRWRGYVHQYPTMHVLWDHIQRQGYDVNQPSEHHDVFHQWVQEVSLAVRLKHTNDEIVAVQQVQRSSQGGQAAHFRERIVTLEQEITVLTGELSRCRKLQQETALQHGLFAQLERVQTQWLDALLGMERQYEIALDALAADVLQRDITAVQSQLGAVQHTHNAKRVLLGVIANTEAMLTSYEEEFATLDLISRETRKLVADSLKGFVECFVTQMNSVVGTVWSYDLQILPCGLKGDDLDYGNIPYLRGTDSVPVSDISETSTSISDIFDFAFRLTVMLYLELEDYPLFIDELGASFDVKHRAEIHAFISRLMESRRYSAVFMISHYVAGWGSYSEAEYLVLDPRNITAPDPHNQHAVLS